MRLHAFRIKNFRSIIDTGFHELSPDGISLLVGQNESGKSSILEALRSFETGIIVEDDLRSSGNLPEVTCIFKLVSFQDVLNCVPKGKLLPKDFEERFDLVHRCISFSRVWDSEQLEKEGSLVIENSQLKTLWQLTKQNEHMGEDVNVDDRVKESEFIKLMFARFPSIEIFEDNSLLPATIDLQDLIDENTDVEGFEGAKNFLLIAEIEAKDLKERINVRMLDDMLDQTNKKINSELQKYWHQTIGKGDKIEIRLELKHHSEKVLNKQGKPYLIFWIRDRNGNLSPLQRSKGVKWFISFYLKLVATSKSSRPRVFLIDEPGANLHAKAQKDILNVFEKQRGTIQIIFSTHSPYLLDIEKVYRVSAVERIDIADDKSATKIIAFHELGSASTDTLLPIYTNMGVDVSHQQVISKKNNVLLEEISAFFYLKAFWKLFSKQETANFLPATGCPNVPQLANLMLGWGLSFSVVLDDDSHGRRIFNQLKESRVCDEHKLLKISDCSGIEDLFTREDFLKIVLKIISETHSKPNSDFIKSAKISKVITARDFMIEVNEGRILLTDLSLETTSRIDSLLNEIISTLN